MQLVSHPIGLLYWVKSINPARSIWRLHLGRLYIRAGVFELRAATTIDHINAFMF